MILYGRHDRDAILTLSAVDDLPQASEHVQSLHNSGQDRHTLVIARGLDKVSSKTW